MTNPAIRVENLGKKYRIRHQQKGPRYKTLRDALAAAPKSWWEKLSRKSSQASTRSVEDFWAVSNVSFEIQQGEAVGIIGRNGAGKSTLLKLLSRITEPSTGRIEIEGRIASLLEVGTGFHPELTGRENIYLNGAILGMKRAEIKARFDEIVAFAEVEKFLDTAVKHYSSGMYMRLAFAVAAHLEPEILVVDEVLAVGDMEFQKKCLLKMEDIHSGGRTVLFVSHNMDLISKLCDRAVLLNAGSVQAIGQVNEITRQYLSQAASNSARFEATNQSRPLRRAWLDEDALLQEQLVLTIAYRFPGNVAAPTFGIVIYTESGSPIFGSNTMYHQPSSDLAKQQEGQATVTFGQLPIWSGSYRISIWLTDSWNPIDFEEFALTFEFVSPSAPLNAPPASNIGPVHLPANWTFTKQ